MPRVPARGNRPRRLTIINRVNRGGNATLSIEETEPLHARIKRKAPFIASIVFVFAHPVFARFPAPR